MDWDQYKKRYDTLPYSKKIELWKEYNLIPHIPKLWTWHWWKLQIEQLKKIAKKNNTSLKKVCDYAWYIVEWHKACKIDPWEVCENTFKLIKCLEFCID